MQLRCFFACSVVYLSTGFADARIDVRALRVQIMPALAIEMVCCSIASWRMERVESDICGAVEYRVSIVTKHMYILF